MPFIAIDVYYTSKFENIFSSSLYIAAGAVINLMLIYHTMIVYTTKICVSADDLIIITNLFFKKTFRKSEIIKIVNSDWQPEYIILLNDKRKIRLSHYIVGINELVKTISDYNTENKK
jgi:hypothetical protein